MSYTEGGITNLMFVFFVWLVWFCYGCNKQNIAVRGIGLLPKHYMKKMECSYLLMKKLVILFVLLL